MCIRRCVLFVTFSVAAEHQYGNSRGAAGKLGYKGRSGEPRHMECYHDKRQISGKRRLFHKDERLSRTCDPLHALIDGFKGSSARVCLKWIVINQQDGWYVCRKCPRFSDSAQNNLQHSNNSDAACAGAVAPNRKQK